MNLKEKVEAVDFAISYIVVRLCEVPSCEQCKRREKHLENLRELKTDLENQERDYIQ
jgi:hypothetical protein